MNEQQKKILDEMRNGPTPEPKRRTFPKWTREEEEFWTDMFDAYSQAFIGATLPDNYEAGKQLIWNRELPWEESQYADCVRAAAVIADVAVQERQYRGFIQKTAHKQTKRKKTPKRRPPHLGRK